ncbi:hypothetical protein BGZ58_002424 [Dissophora ornata]|nr:hypothetical protein BGZ58_002424 [Dissophora ornata]
MDSPEDPMNWDAERVAKWLKSTFNFPEETLHSFIGNDVDGPVLLLDMDHDALKNEFGIASFGLRCHILKQIRILRATANQDNATMIAGSPMSPTVMNLGGLDIAEPVSRSTVLNRTYTISRFQEEEQEVQPIQLLEEPLHVMQEIVTKGSSHIKNRREMESDEISLSDSDGKSGLDSGEEESGHDDSEDADVEDVGYQSNADDNMPLAARIKKRKDAAMISGIGGVPIPNTYRSLPAGTSTPKRVAPTPVSPALTTQANGVTTVLTGSGLKRIAPTLVSTSFPAPQDLVPATTSTASLESRRVNINNSPKTGMRAKENVKRQPHLSHIGLSLRDIFFNKDGAALESDSEDEWCMPSSRLPKKISPLGHQLIVQKNLKRILREPPIFEIPGHVVFAPMRRRNRDVPVKLLSPTSSGNKVAGASNRGAPLVEPENDSIYPLYGDSDASAYTTDEELYKEVAKEEQQRLNRGSKKDSVQKSKAPLLRERVQEIIEEYRVDYRKHWEKISMRLMEGRRFMTYSRLMKDSDKVSPIESIEVAAKTLSDVRLPSIIEAIAETSYTSVDEVRKACKAMDRTLGQIFEHNWKLDLLKGPVPSPDMKPNQVGEPGLSAYTYTRDELETDVSADHTSMSGRSQIRNDRHVSTDEEAELDEERRQQELDDAFIDDSELLMDVDGESELDADGDSAMEERPLQRRRKVLPPLSGAKKPHPKEFAADKSRGQKNSDRLLSLPSPPSTTTSPKGDLQFSEAEPYLEDEERLATSKRRLEIGEHLRPSPEDPAADDEEKDTSPAEEHTHRDIAAPSPIYIDLDDNEVPAQELKRQRSRSPTIQAHSSEAGRAPSRPTGSSSKHEVNIDQGALAVVIPSMKRARIRAGTKVPSKAGGRQSPFAEDIIALDGSIQDINIEDEVSEGMNYELDSQLEVNADFTSDSSDEVSEAPRDKPALSKPSTGIKPMKYPNWRESCKDDEKIRQMVRQIRRGISVGRDVSHQEPYLSIWQEYVEWVELDCGNTSIDFKEFLRWKDDGNSTTAYREVVLQAAATQAAAEKAAARKEKKEKKAREKQEGRELKERLHLEERQRSQKQAREARELMRKKLRESREKRERLVREAHEKKETAESEESAKNKRASAEEHEAAAKSSAAIMILSDSDEGPSTGRDQQTRTAKDTENSDGDTIASLDRVEQVVVQPKEKEGKEGDMVNADDVAAAQSSRSPNLKKRPRVIRNHFGDTTEESSSSGEEEGEESKRHSKRKTPRPMKLEAEEVLKLRQDAAKNEAELEMRIKEQEERAKLRESTSLMQEGEVLINPGHKDTERPVVIPAFLAKNLKPHQLDGVRFMWKNVVMFDGGCILAHSMGLGKTFQAIAFIYVLLRELRDGNRDIPQKLQEGRVLLLMPPIVLQNWHDEFQKWIPPQEQDVVRVRRMSLKKTDVSTRIKVLEEWHKKGGVFLIGYAMFRELCTTNSRSSRNLVPEVTDMFQKLLQQGASITIADEGHTIKNSEAKLAAACKGIKSTARVILTGYPLQNRLEEYWCMVDFVRPNYLGDPQTFRHNYIRPISDGLYPDSSSFEKKASAKKLKVLIELIKNFVMRKDQSVLRASLPKKVEFVISCKLSTLQYFLYTSFLPTVDHATKAVLGNGHILLTICNHPAAFKATLMETFKKSEKDKGKALCNSSEDKPTPAIDPPAMTAKEGGTGEEDADESAENEIVQALRHHIVNEAGLKSMKLDGSTRIVDRQAMINEFNASNDYDAFLISSGAGSLGVNLVSASRVVIFDVGWNPSHDEQAIARAFRYGQTRKVFVYRLHTFGTWEDKLYKTNLHKMGLSNRVVDKKNISKAFTKVELKSYFDVPPKLNPEWSTPENVDALFNKTETEDPVLRAVIAKNTKFITSLVPQSDLIREEDSDLTEADMVEIQNMIDEEQRRIDGKPPLPASAVPIPPREAAQYEKQLPLAQQQQIYHALVRAMERDEMQGLGPDQSLAQGPSHQPKDNQGQNSRQGQGQVPAGVLHSKNKGSETIAEPGQFSGEYLCTSKNRVSGTTAGGGWIR